MSWEDIKLFVLSCLAGLVLLSFFAAPFMLPKLSRSHRLKKLARKHNLSFQMKFWSNVTFSDMADHMEQNVIEGTLEGKIVRVYDSFDINNSIRNPLMVEFISGKNSSKPYIRKTILEIDGKKEVIPGSFFFPFATVRKITERIEKI